MKPNESNELVIDGSTDAGFIDCTFEPQEKPEKADTLVYMRDCSTNKDWPRLVEYKNITIENEDGKVIRRINHLVIDRDGNVLIRDIEDVIDSE